MNVFNTHIFRFVLTSFVKENHKKYNRKKIQRIIEDKLVLKGEDARKAEKINKR
jgi:hypothetical protein